jgi:hypothetical protein
MQLRSSAHVQNPRNGECRRVAAVAAVFKENTAADGIELSAKQIERLNNLTPATGERHEEANMALNDR